MARLHDVADEPVCLKPFSFEFEQQPLSEDQMKDMIYQEAIALNPEYAWFENSVVWIWKEHNSCSVSILCLIYQVHRFSFSFFNVGINFSFICFT